MFRLTIFTVLLAIAAATDVKNCNDIESPIAVRIKGCDKMPCNVVKGTTAEFEIDFIAIADVKELTAKVKATALGVTVSYPLPDDVANVCANLLNGQSCPLDNQEDGTYKFLFPIEKYYPEISVAVQVSLEDQNKLVHTCFVADIKVKG